MVKTARLLCRAGGMMVWASWQVADEKEPTGAAPLSTVALKAFVHFIDTRPCDAQLSRPKR
jgi:hypothetical protein